MKKKNKGKDLGKKEEVSEDWCFACKDGGLLLVCEYKHCIKSYHPECVGKEQSFTETGKRWICSRHSCFICHKKSAFHCIGCPNAVCRRCIRVAEFVNIRQKKSLCNDCLRLALLVEENVDYDSDGGKIDFKDRNTYECLFKEYWDLIKDDEGVTLQDLHFADTLLKKGESYKSGSDSDKLYEGEHGDGHLISDSDVSMDDRMENRSSMFEESPKGLLAAMKRKIKKRKEFIGWGSRALVEFLTSIGKDPTKPLSQYEVHDIIKTYIHQNKLTHPEKKKKIVCDIRLQSVFGKKSVNRNRLYDLLEPHFIENQDSSEEDEFSDKSGEEGVANTCKRQRRVSTDKRSNEKETVMVAPKSCFASIIVENMKLIYLKKSVIEDLLKKPDTFEDKVVGSFVRVKCDPDDYFQKSPYQLLQVTGVKRPSEAAKSITEVIVEVSNRNDGISVCKLSEDDITEEECEDLRQRVKDGLLKRPTIWEFEEKAKVLHEEITNHWIGRELLLLQNQIDRANEKGWRRELCEYLERRKLLQSPEERLRLMKEVPCVIADELETEVVPVELSTGGNSENEDAPLSIFSSAAETLDKPFNLKDGGRDIAEAGGVDYQESKTLAIEGQALLDETPALQIIIPVLPGAENGNGESVNQKGEDQALLDVTPALQIIIPVLPGDEDDGNGKSVNQKGEDQALMDETPALQIILPVLPGAEDGIGESVNQKASVMSCANNNYQVSIQESQQQNSDIVVHESYQSHLIANDEQLQLQLIEVNEQNSEIKDLYENKKNLEMVESKRDTEVVDLIDDQGETADTSGNLVLLNPESAIWKYVDPFGDEQGPFSMNQLKKWSDGNYFRPDFRVWKTGQTQEATILLTDAMAQVFPQNR